MQHDNQTSIARLAARRCRRQSSRRKRSTSCKFTSSSTSVSSHGFRARLACFNVDESFSGVVDGLIVVDLLRTEPKVLQKYMGREQVAAFIAYTREQPSTLADTYAAK